MPMQYKVARWHEHHEWVRPSRLWVTKGIATWVIHRMGWARCIPQSGSNVRDVDCFIAGSARCITGLAKDVTA